jgi:site-specific DNA recombinase
MAPGLKSTQALVELIKEAFAIQKQLLSGSDDSIVAMSGRVGMNKCRLTSLLRLSHLAPEILGALLAGRHPIQLTLLMSRSRDSTSRS